MNPNTLWITRTAMFTALLVVMQAITAPLGNTLITGTVVNLILVMSVMVCGQLSGLTVSLISPVLAKLVGIGPFWSLVPFIMAGNVVLILIWYYLGRSDIGDLRKVYIPYISAVLAAVAKFLVLYIGVGKIAVPILLNLPEPQASVISNIFSFPQFLTALAGGVFAAIILPTIKKAIKT